MDLMRQLRAYDVMKETHKIIVYDTMLPFKHAYFSLVEYGECKRRAGLAFWHGLGGACGRGLLARDDKPIESTSYDAQLVSEDHYYITIP